MLFDKNESKSIIFLGGKTMKKFAKIMALLLALVMVLSCVAGCKKKPAADDTTPDANPQGKAEYTFRGYAVQLGNNWNPHTWRTNSDKMILQYLQTPLVTATVKDSEQGVYQWAYKAAASITDVTEENQDDLTKFKATGKVFEIKLNPDMKWQDGTQITADDYVASMKALLDPAMKNYRASNYYTGESALAGAGAYFDGTAASFEDSVGCYKVDELTIRYVTQNKIGLNEFLTACTSNWLVHKATYEQGIKTEGDLKTTNYGTSMETTMSYGPYKMESLQAGKQVVFTQNENYYQYTKLEDGSLRAETDYEVDGEKVQAYQTTKIVIDVMADETAKQAFLKGELSEWTPSADEMETYITSDQMHQVDQTYTHCLFFNSDEAALKAMDKSKGNQNSVVLTNNNFRKAFSMAIDRRDWVTATAGYKPAFYLINDQYYYDIYNDPTSTYRSSGAAKQGLVDLYGLRYADGLVYSDLEEAHDSLTGYDLDEAQKLMKTACDELVQAGLYKAGEEIKIRIAYSAGALGSSEQSQVAKINQYLNTAMEGSGFGTITLEAVGDIAERHDKVGSGEYAIGYGAWGGDAFSPFTNMQNYLDPQLNKIHEKGCWDPATETLTLKVGGENVAMTWKEWSHVLVGNGKYADASMGTKLEITAALEREFLNKFYRIPLAADCDASLLSYQVANYTDNYNVMYGFGGIELMTYNYTDAEWAEYVANAGGTLNYE